MTTLDSREQQLRAEVSAQMSAIRANFEHAEALLRQQLAMAEDAAAKGEQARLNAGAMQDMIAQLRADLEKSQSELKGFDADYGTLLRESEESEEIIATLRADLARVTEELDEARSYHGLHPDISKRLMAALGTRHDELFEESVHRVVRERDAALARATQAEAERDKFTQASSSKTDWCPCCKQGWDCATRDKESRVKLHQAEAQRDQMREALEACEQVLRKSNVDKEDQLIAWRVAVKTLSSPPAVTSAGEEKCAICKKRISKVGRTWLHFDGPEPGHFAEPAPHPPSEAATTREEGDKSCSRQGSSDAATGDVPSVPAAAEPEEINVGGSYPQEDGCTCDSSVFGSTVTCPIHGRKAEPETGTPLTDEAVASFACEQPSATVVTSKFARSLERRLIASQARVATLEEWIEALPKKRKGFHDTYNGGHHDNIPREAFHHGMDTVFNALENYVKFLLPSDRK